MMSDNKIRAALLHLGSNMWRKKGFDGPPVKDVEDFVYRDEMFCQKEVWIRVTNMMAKLEFNTVVIDIGEGVRLDSHPELAVPGSWTKDEMREELARLRSIGLDPVPKFNFSPGHSAWMGDWAYRFGTPEFDVFCKDIIEETIELFDTPTFFHVIIKKGVRPAAWMDLKNFETMDCDVPKEVIFFTWYYGSIRDVATLEEAHSVIQLIHKYVTLGYDVIATPSTWGFHLNSKETMKACKKHVPDNEHMMGYMTASWMLTRENKYFALVNDLYTFYAAYRDVFGTLPETTVKPWELVD